jgi:protein-L-isoaspartate(D-aspartate) O-methyltransferase
MRETTREEMLERIRKRGVSDPEILAVMGDVDRKNFIPREWKQFAYDDSPLPIGYGQTISQPYTVARMLELLIRDSRFKIQDLRVLEIGTGSGWQTVILAKLYPEVYSVEVVPELAKKARNTIDDLRYTNIKIKIGDGKKGWKEFAPYDGIICGADADEIPQGWLEQLGVGGRIVCPVKGVMTRMTKNPIDKLQITNHIQNPKYFKTEEFGEYSFVPLV